METCILRISQVSVHSKCTQYCLCYLFIIRYLWIAWSCIVLTEAATTLCIIPSAYILLAELYVSNIDSHFRILTDVTTSFPYTCPHDPYRRWHLLPYGWREHNGDGGRRDLDYSTSRSISSSRYAAIRLSSKQTWSGCWVRTLIGQFPYFHVWFAHSNSFR